MISKRTCVGVIAAMATMTLLACQKSFNMTCDPANPSKSVCEGSKASATTVTPMGNISLEVQSAVAIPQSDDGAGSYGGLQMALQISGDHIPARTININVQGAGNQVGNIQTQPNEPRMRYMVRCFGSDSNCATMDVGIYVEISNKDVRVFAVRVNGSSIVLSTNKILQVDNIYVRMDDPTGTLALMNSPMP